jgi:hypothetical protein
MSMEIHILSDRLLTSIAAWQAAIDAEGFDLKLDQEVQLQTTSGFVPAMLHGKLSGFECYHDDFRELKASYSDVPYFKSCPDWKQVLSFRWGSLAHEGVSVFMASAAYAKATEGVVYDPEDGKILTQKEVRALVGVFEKLALKEQ